MKRERGYRLLVQAGLGGGSLLHQSAPRLDWGIRLGRALG